MSDRTIVDVPARIVDGKVVELDPRIERQCNLEGEVHQNGIGVPQRSDPWVIIRNTGEPLQVPSRGVAETRNLFHESELVFFQASDEHGERRVVVLPPEGDPVVLARDVTVVAFEAGVGTDWERERHVAIELIGSRRRRPKKRKTPFLYRSQVEGWSRAQWFATNSDPPDVYPVPEPNLFIGFDFHKEIQVGDRVYQYSYVHTGPWGVQVEVSRKDYANEEWHDICCRRFLWSEIEEIKRFMP